MNPGRELDALIAEKVMGWKSIVQPHPEMPPVSLKDLYESPNVPMPKYSTDIAAVWEVIDKLKANLKMTRDGNTGVSVELRFICGDGSIGSIIPATGETFPHAICLAALKAIEPS